jgi:deoxyribose-phosphate aldolase
MSRSTGRHLAHLREPSYLHLYPIFFYLKLSKLFITTPDTMDKKILAKYIDHTLLKAEAEPKDIEKLCSEAMNYQFAAVCVNPSHVSGSKDLLGESGVLVATVIGFPLGATTSTNKFRETKEATQNGADEIDMVINVGLLKSGALTEVGKEIGGVVEAAGGAPVKVIIETGLLNEKEISKVSSLCVENGAAFVKTSTGFGPRGASVEDVKLIKSVVGDDCKIKASGGIKTREQALKMIEAGADRIGTSSGIQIIEGG